MYRLLLEVIEEGMHAQVLTAMNREYTIEEWCYVVDFLIENVPNITIATVSLDAPSVAWIHNNGS
jgi:hypothetical protein